MSGFRFSKFIPPKKANKSGFEHLNDIFKQLILMTSGNVSEALSWLTNLDKQYGLTDDKYGIGDFIQDLKDKGYIEEDSIKGTLSITAKSEQDIRKSALEEIFGKLKKSKKGNHSSVHRGLGDEKSADKREFRFGDNLDQISVTDSIRNAQVNHGLNDFHLTENDLEIVENEHKAQTSTVLMIDISHSMILYGEDRITPAKKVAMALAELITKTYKKDTLDIIVFGNEGSNIIKTVLVWIQRF